MKTILKSQFVLLLANIIISCHQTPKCKNIETELVPRYKYDTVTVIYTAEENPWLGFTNPYDPQNFKRVYADQLKGMKIWDTIPPQRYNVERISY